MSALSCNFALVTRYVRTLRGGSQRTLAQASDGELYVAKFSHSLQGDSLTFSEIVGTELYHACNLPVPQWKLLWVADSFLDQNEDCWMKTPEGRVRPNSGFCFGSRFLGGDNVRLFEILAETSFRRVCNRKSFWLAWLVDICAGHTDNRQAVFQANIKGTLKAFFVDHGRMFGSPKGEQQQPLLALRYLDPRIYQRIPLQRLVDLVKVPRPLEVERLWQRIEALPDAWRTASALEGLARCLDRLSNADFLHDVLDTMVDLHTQAHRFEHDDSRFRRDLPLEVLRPRISPAGFAHSPACGQRSGPGCA